MLSGSQILHDITDALALAGPWRQDEAEMDVVAGLAEG